MIATAIPMMVKNVRSLCRSVFLNMSLKTRMVALINPLGNRFPPEN